MTCDDVVKLPKAGEAVAVKAPADIPLSISNSAIFVFSSLFALFNKPFSFVNSSLANLIIFRGHDVHTESTNTPLIIYHSFVLRTPSTVLQYSSWAFGRALFRPPTQLVSQ